MARVNIITAFLVVIIICIFWFWYMLANPPQMVCRKFEQVSFKTGDIILFHAYNNINPVIICSYWGHIGIVYVDPDDPDAKPMLFEAARITQIKNCPEYNKSGIIITDLKTRIEKYPGLIACKFLNRPVHEGIARGMKEFITYARNNMSYNESVIHNGIKKKKGEIINNYTNCGELVVLSLIKLGLLPESVLKEKIAHHLLYAVNLTQLQNNHYLKPVEITLNPF